jgi:short-subunit dehydrogenase
MATLSTPRRILITGASRGIGRATALALAARGHTVVLAARNAAALARVAAEITAAGGRAETLIMDVTDDRSVARAVTELLNVGPCDVVVNNAGSGDQAEFLVQADATRRAEMELNYFGALRVTRALLPSFVRRKAGMIVNVSSLLGTIASSTTANYSATKAALEAFSHALRGEVGRFGVQVVVFVAPHTQTEAGAQVQFKGVKSLPAEYTAAELVRAIDRGARSYAASPVYRALLRVARLFPVMMESQVQASARHLLLEDPLARSSA